MLPTESATSRAARPGRHPPLVRSRSRTTSRSRCRPRFSTSSVACTVRSNRNVATFIKELVLVLPEGEEVPFRAGGYIQIECPPHTVHYKDFAIEERFRDDWDKYRLWDLVSRCDETVTRAYSMANYPEEKGLIMLNVRIAPPPPRASQDIPPGFMSSYIFGLKPATRSRFPAPTANSTPGIPARDGVYRGRRGMAPCAPIFSTSSSASRPRARSASGTVPAAFVKRFTSRTSTRSRPRTTISGGPWRSRSRCPRIAGKARSDLSIRCCWTTTSASIPRPKTTNTTICGPPMMNTAVINMLQDLGVEEENILFDDFGL